MFGEPILELLRIHGDRFHDRLCEIRDSLTGIAQNTEAQIARNQWVNKSVEAAEKSTEQLRNNEAYGWLVRDIAATVECEVFLNTETGDGFVCKLKAGERENVHWYVPPGSVIFVKNLAAATGFANMQVEALVTNTRSAHTGKSEEHVDTPQREPTMPSGHPVQP